MKDLRYLGSRTGEFVGDRNDISFDSRGDIVTVEGSDRLKQDITKILLTERGLLPYPNYGSTLQFIPGSRLTDPSLLSYISDDVIVALRYLSEVEQSLDLSELIGEITQMDVEYVAGAIQITLNINTAARSAINLQLEV